MRMAGIVFLILVMAAGVIKIGYCDEMAGKYKVETVGGAVESVDIAGSKLVLQTGIERTFPISNDTVFIDGTYNDPEEYQINLSAIETGDDVSVEYYRNDKGVIKTMKVTLRFDKSKNEGYEPAY